MRKSQELSGPGCLSSAADDEPLFVLRANDELAPDIVREWVRRYYDSKMDRQGKLTAQQKTKKDNALTLAHDMEIWVENRDYQLRKAAAAAKAAAKAERVAKKEKKA